MLSAYLFFVHYQVVPGGIMRSVKKIWVVFSLVLILSLFGAGTALAKTQDREMPPEKTCSAQPTGRWIATYYRSGYDHWVTKCRLYVPDDIDNQKDAEAWRWSAEYIAEQCSLDSEPQTWAGTYVGVEKETKKICKHTLIFY
jgi:hypothetical protein